MKENIMKSVYAMEIFALLVPPVGKASVAKNISAHTISKPGLTTEQSRLRIDAAELDKTD